MKKIIPFDVIKMTSRFNDGSWAIITKSGISYRFIDEDLKKNERWVTLLIGNQLEDENEENDSNNQQDDNLNQSVSSNEGLEINIFRVESY